MRVITKLVPFLLLSALVACGGGSGGGSSSDNGTPVTQGAQAEENTIDQFEVVTADGSNINGTYVAQLYPVNYNLHLLNPIGWAGVQRNGDSLVARARLKYGPKNTYVRQAIYSGVRCPTLEDDLNKDWYIDINEARIAIGMVVVPFDADVDSQLSGQGGFPLTDTATGGYFYRQTASFSRFFEDLKAVDENPTDEIMKLGLNDGLLIPNKVVLIQGISPDVILPATVGSNDGRSALETLPIACGYMRKVAGFPAE
jgi:hypothetical protein